MRRDFFCKVKVKKHGGLCQHFKRVVVEYASLQVPGCIVATLVIKSRKIKARDLE
jgi:hypothetical protein